MSNPKPTKEQIRAARYAPRPGVTPLAAAQMLGLGWPRFKKAIGLGEIKVLTFGGRKYVPKSELERLKKLLEDM